MPTIVTKSIGSGGGRDYSTMQAWEDACPANLVTADQVWKGEAYNDAVFTESLTIAGETTDATRYLWLTAAAGQSFRDNASIRTVALDYGGAATGVTLQHTAGYTIPLICNTGVDFAIDRIQIRQEGYFAISGSANVTFRNCIVKAQRIAAPGVMVNCLLISAAGASFAGWSSSRLEFCTLIALSGGDMGSVVYATVTFENCAFFGFSAGVSGSVLAGDYNCTDLASAPGAHSLTSKTFANQFVSTTNDFRAKSGADLANNGTPATSYATDDISATARSASTPTIGAWELVATGGGLVIPVAMAQYRQRWN